MRAAVEVGGDAHEPPHATDPVAGDEQDRDEAAHTEQPGVELEAVQHLVVVRVRVRVRARVRARARVRVRVRVRVRISRPAPPRRPAASARC